VRKTFIMNDSEKTELENNTFHSLAIEVEQLIVQSKNKIVSQVNSSITLLYWNIGKRIKQEILKEQRAEYGKRVFTVLSRELTKAHGKGWSEQQLRQCVRCAEVFSDEQILYTLCIELSWSHIRTLMFIEDTLKRDFYIEICKMEHWSVRQLNERIDSMLFERTSISKKSPQTISDDIELLRKDKRLTTDMAFRDPVILNFLGLKDTYSEKDLESAILANLQSFIMELGSDFAFLARQKRIIIDNVDYYMDLLFFHRKLKRLIVIELKLGRLKVEHKSQIELYLRWLDKYERTQGENSPMGILLCAEKSNSLVELLELGKSGIHAAQYLTELPDKKILEAQLRKSIQMAREKNEKQKNEK
jgi:Uncharacterized conserved protein